PTHSTPCSGGVCPGETLTPVQPTGSSTNTPTTNSCTIIDCVAGYHASGPVCSAAQSCIPNTSASSTPTATMTFSAWPNSGVAPLLAYFTIAHVTSPSGYSVSFGDGASGSAWQADTEAANTYYVSHTY